ncbi:MAG TPA: helix-turn-helix domain-containing protein [Acidimicrobiales bacterium]|nr:helix-turn-helix domain-containing protein [Acidimicrobiales bacterium]
MAGGPRSGIRKRRPASPPAGRRAAGVNGLRADDVVEAALRVVEREGAEALTMRRLAEELGTAVTAIYWHVGNRDELVDRMVERLIEDMGHVHASGRNPRSRIAGLAHELRARLLERPHLVALADQRGMTAAMFQPVQVALADELRALGVTGRRAGRAIQVLQCHVVASVVLARAVDRSPSRHDRAPLAWEGRSDDPGLIEELGREPDLDAAFAVGLDALLDRLVDDGRAAPSPDAGRPGPGRG